MKPSIYFLLVIFSCSTLAKGLSPYLPLNTAYEAEALIDQLLAITPGAPLTKPYKAVEVYRRLEQIETSHPSLYGQLSRYMSRYTRTYGRTHIDLELALSDDGEQPLANNRGAMISDSYALSSGAFYQPSPYFLASAGINYSEAAGFRHTNSYLGFGYEYAQFEFGYREHWFSPFKYSSMLVSTHAEPSPSITVSNATPITDWNIRYELFYSKLESVEGIRLGDKLFPGSPRHGGLHLSFTPFEFWTLGLNRTLQFGGGERDVDLGDVFEALFNPAGKDNLGRDEKENDPNYEFGNQQASITTQLNLNWGMPFQVYGEFGGEDTLDESNYKLGNQTFSVGLYLPMVAENLSLRYEHNHWSTAWYVHHLYPDGYTNAGRLMGHWGAEQKVENTAPPASVDTLGINYQWPGLGVLHARIALIRNEQRDAFDYQRGYQVELQYSHATSYGFFGAGLLYSKTTLGDTQSRLNIYYRW
ncbi:capsule assembly Wzi family protein [Saliniradius amylolyticus]|uniref:capsule assembly Wzi family protein n=1 Tax=Saliniradius amylolyticus TaxID=2183582 RepID=UPI0013A557AF|nr:capsule assembly Wzi family protein [Saliniradius amylolyticus]